MGKVGRGWWKGKSGDEKAGYFGGVSGGEKDILVVIRDLQYFY
jgi:hypothetical protein